MTSTLGIKKIQHPNGTNIATLDSSGSIAFAGAITGTLATAAQPNVNSLGTLSTLTVDDITINGSTISDAGDFTLDIGGDITLDADGQQIYLKNNGTHWGTLLTNGTPQHFYIDATISDGDIIFRGNDGGSTINALTLDMSAAGQANFNSNIFTGNTGEFVDGSGAGDKGVQINPIGMVVSTRNGGISGIFGRQTNDGDIIQLRKGGSAVGSIGVTSGDQIYIGRSTGSQGIKLKNSALLPSSNAGADADNSKDLGSSSARWKDLYLSGGLRVGGTGIPNQLDDYEEGTFNVLISTDSTYGGETQSGVYTKIGDICFFQIRFQRSGTLNSGVNARTSLPFTSANNGVQASGFRGSVENIDTSMVGIGGTIAANNTILYLNEMTAATTGTNVNGNDLGANFQIQIQGFYKTS